ncbi:MAG: hypothetical protein R3C49_15260 [Planctomycetaceae bacterium]
MNQDSQARVRSTLSRVVLLGASNLTLAWPRILRLLQSKFHEPMQIFTAQGMGRSYVCDQSRFGNRVLPGILQSELWSALKAAWSADDSSEAPRVLLTDFGNDLLYGRSALEISQGAEQCVRQLQECDPRCQIVLTLPPVESVHDLGRFRFGVCRRILFPASRLTLSEIRSQTTELAERLAELEQPPNVRLFQPQRRWYGLDPIHVKRRHQTEAFASMMSDWQISEPAVVSDAAPVRRTRPQAAVRWVRGKEHRTAQPAIKSQGVEIFSF